jgi:hypothetical protein
MQHAAEIPPPHAEAPALERIDIETKRLDALNRLNRRAGWALIGTILLMVICIASAIIASFDTFLTPILNLLYIILMLSLTIIGLRKTHPGHVYTLWYLFFLMTGCGFGIYFYLDKSGWVDIDPSYHVITVVESSSVTGGFLDRALKWYLNTAIVDLFARVLSDLKPLRSNKFHSPVFY